MEKNKYKFLMSLVLMTFFVGLVSATVTLQHPAASTTNTGATVYWNVSFSSFEAVGDCTIYGKSTSTANSSYTYAANALNISSNFSFNPSVLNGTFDSTTLEDSNDYTFFASCVNGSNIMQNSSANTITLNNSVPNTPSSISPSDGNIDSDGSVSFSATVDGNDTTGCTLVFPNRNPGSSSYTMTHSGNSCSYTLSSVADETYDWYITSSDGSETADSSTISFGVDQKTSSGKAGALALENGINSKGGSEFSIASNVGGIPIWLIVVLVVIGIIVVINKK